MHRCFWVSIVVLGLSSCSGEAGRPVFLVRGQVFVAGQPAGGAVLTFLPAELPADGRTLEMIKARVEPDGSFRPITYSRPAYTPRPGMPADEYVVTVKWPDEKGDDQLQDQGAHPKTPAGTAGLSARHRDQLRGRYADPKPPAGTAGLSARHHDRLRGKYADPKTTPLRVSISGRTDLPPFELTTDPH
jgi:hypothetical protein